MRRLLCVLLVVVAVVAGALVASAADQMTPRLYVPAVLVQWGELAPTPTATPRPTATPVPAVTATPVPPPACRSVLVNGGFEDGLQGWRVTSGLPFPDTSAAHDGKQGLVIGFKLSNFDMIAQLIRVPDAAQTLYVSYWWRMWSEDSTTSNYDSFYFTIYDTNLSTVEKQRITNTAQRKVWGQNHMVVDVRQRRGQELAFTLNALSDESLVTWWEIDTVQATFDCEP